jgi:hypothetical protein
MKARVQPLQSRLPSDSAAPFHPGTHNDLDKVNGRWPKERGRVTIGSWNTWQIDRAGLFDITTGADTIKYWRLGSTHRDVWSAIRMTTMGSHWVQPIIQACNDYDRYPQYEAIDKRIVAFLQDAIADMLFQSFEASRQDLMDWGKICGFAVGEPIWQVIDGHQVIRAIKTYPSYDFTPIIDEYHNLNAVYHYPTGACYDPGAFIWAAWPRIVGSSWLGMSELRAIRADLLIIERMEEARVKNGTALSRLPVLVAYNPLMAEPEIAQFKQGIQNALNGKGDGIVFAPGRMDENGKFNPQATINLVGSRASVEAMRVLDLSISEGLRGIKRHLGMLDDLGATTVLGGSRAKAETQFNLTIARFEEGQRWDIDVVNRQVLRPLIEFNYPTLPLNYRYPRFVAPEIQEEFSTSKAEFVQTLYATGALTQDADDTAWARKFLGLPPMPQGADIMVDPAMSPGGALPINPADTAYAGVQTTAQQAIVEASYAGKFPRESAIAQLMSAYNKTYVEASRLVPIPDEPITAAPGIKPE